MIGGLLRKVLGSDYSELLSILRTHDDGAATELEFPYVFDLVSNTVCADLLDYVPRDLAACGMHAQIGDRFLDFFVVTPRHSLGAHNGRRMALVLDKKGMPRPDVASEVLKLLTLRYELAERVYFHHAKNAASVMIGRAVQALKLNLPDRNFWGLSDETLLQVLLTPEAAKALSVRLREGGDPTLARQLAQGIVNRRLYKIAYLGIFDDLREQVSDLTELTRPGDRLTWENEVAQAAGISNGRVLVHVPAEKGMRKTANVRVSQMDGQIVRLETWEGDRSRRVVALNDAHERLWKITVYIHPDESRQKRARVQRIVTEKLGGVQSRYEYAS
jgi:HD superfamily phosphohydrolase